MGPAHLPWHCIPPDGVPDVAHLAGQAALSPSFHVSAVGAPATAAARAASKERAALARLRACPLADVESRAPRMIRVHTAVFRNGTASSEFAALPLAAASRRSGVRAGAETSGGSDTIVQHTLARRLRTCLRFNQSTGKPSIERSILVAMGDSS